MNERMETYIIQRRFAYLPYVLVPFTGPASGTSKLSPYGHAAQMRRGHGLFYNYWNIADGRYRDPHHCLHVAVKSYETPLQKGGPAQN